jgi:tRNA uridine 5-carboxymethylaminomethyl modification enzyme
MSRYDVIVVGGGHAGAEAAMAAARLGGRVLLLTQQLETIGQMSCNPAIGGIAKGTVVREVDALGGVMGRATDQARIQFRMLNRSKGPAVWSPRAQCDRGLYRSAVRSLLEGNSRIGFAQGTVSRLGLRGGRVTGVVTGDGRVIEASAVVITAGTFLRGRIHVGVDTALPAGRAGEPPSVELSQAIAAEGVTLLRFKTGTPPRIDGRTVEFAQLTPQEGDPEPFWFSFHAQASPPPQLPCWLTYTGPRLRSIVEARLRESAMYGGAIGSRGPRYCPSIEDKILRFPDAHRHQIFLEPEGLNTREMYVNGLSTSLPVPVQLELLRTIPGLDQVEMTRPGYAIEYDYLPPTQLRPTLESKAIEALFFAGQVNGTTGYEEAAGQGFVAGFNAAAAALGEAPLVLRRDEAVLGTLVDDLITRGVDEPYRLFTSRLEFRLLLRQDNALRRLAPVALERGLWTDTERAAAEGRLELEDKVMACACSRSIAPGDAEALLLSAGGQGTTGPVRLAELVKRPGVSLARLFSAAGIEVPSGDACAWAEIELKYAGYLGRERVEAARLRELESLAIPPGFRYLELTTLSFEAREKLSRIQPETLGHAGRVPGVSPSDLHALAREVLRPRVSRETLPPFPVSQTLS